MCPSAQAGEAFTGSARLTAGVALVCTVLVMVTGDLQARLMDTQQPMKMAAAGAVYRTQAGASFSLLTIGNLSGQPVFQTRIPHLLSLIATLSWNGTVDGITQVQNAEAARYGPGAYMPVLWVTYWGFRLMVGFGFLILAASAWALWRSRRGSGKTLVVLTLLRFLDLTAGNLSIDGTDARACSPGEVRALLAWSPEQPTLFPTSPPAGLRVGAPHATDRQITDLLRQLRLGPWLDRLERGLDTVLAPWGRPVSSGELQRLSVARAVLADRPVLLLDEPTRHLDAATADAVLQAVLERAADRSLLWITRRPEELAAFPEVRHLGADPLSASDRPPDRWLRGPVPESAACWLGSPGQRGARR